MIVNPSINVGVCWGSLLTRVCRACISKLTESVKPVNVTRIAFVLFIFIFCPALNAKCLSEEYKSPCRYPAGDAWCHKNGHGNFYAYKDDCLNKKEPVFSSETNNNSITNNQAASEQSKLL